MIASVSVVNRIATPKELPKIFISSILSESIFTSWIADEKSFPSVVMVQ